MVNKFSVPEIANCASINLQLKFPSLNQACIRVVSISAKLDFIFFGVTIFSQLFRADILTLPYIKERRIP